MPCLLLTDINEIVSHWKIILPGGGEQVVDLFYPCEANPAVFQKRRDETEYQLHENCTRCGSSGSKAPLRLDDLVFTGQCLIYLATVAIDADIDVGAVISEGEILSGLYDPCASRSEAIFAR